MNHQLDTIAIVHSPFKEKFGIPRQPGLVSARGQVELLAPYNDPAAVKELEGFSHIWLTFVFHQALREAWKPQVRPPRLGGNKKVGVFASRAPFRPNHLGLSVVRLEGIEQAPGRVVLHVSGIDLVDGTPVVDIKPYVPYVDRVEDAVEGFADAPPQPRFSVGFSDTAESQLTEDGRQDLRELITEVLAFDPRPAYRQQESAGEFGMRLDAYDVRWAIKGDQIWVLAVIPA